MKNVKERKLLWATIFLCLSQVLIVVLTFSSITESSSFLHSTQDLDVQQNGVFVLLFSILFSVASIFLIIGYDCILLIIINAKIFRTKIRLYQTALLVVISNIVSLIIGSMITSFFGYSFTGIGFALSPGTIAKILMFYCLGIYVFKMWKNPHKTILLCCIYYLTSLILASLIMNIVN